MPDYAADDAVAIAKRLKEIQEQEAPPGNFDLATAEGRDLEFIARHHGITRADGEGDYPLRNRIRRKIEEG